MALLTLWQGSTIRLLFAVLLLTQHAYCLPTPLSRPRNIFDKLDNIAVYWGPNLAGISHVSTGQQRLAEYCKDSVTDIIVLPLLAAASTGNSEEFGSRFVDHANDCSVDVESELDNCSTLPADIRICQYLYGKKILLSVNGLTTGGRQFGNEQEAVAAADSLVKAFGPISPGYESAHTPAAQGSDSSISESAVSGRWQSVGGASMTGSASMPKDQPNNKFRGVWQQPRRRSIPSNQGVLAAPPGFPTMERPIGDAVIDGFLLNFEPSEQFVVPFAKALRDRTGAVQGMETYLTAVATCSELTLAEDTLLNSDVHLDAVFVKFYNSPCGLQSFTPGASKQLDFDFASWNRWAAPRRTKVFLGVPAGTDHVSTDFLSAEELAPILRYSRHFSSFGGVAALDVSRSDVNRRYLSSIRENLSSRS